MAAIGKLVRAAIRPDTSLRAAYGHDADLPALFAEVLRRLSDVEVRLSRVEAKLFRHERRAS